MAAIRAYFDHYRARLSTVDDDAFFYLSPSPAFFRVWWLCAGVAGVFGYGFVGHNTFPITIPSIINASEQNKQAI